MAEGRLSPDVGETIAQFREIKMGLNRVALVLRDGRVIEPVFVAWGNQIVTPDGSSPLDIDPGGVVDALDRSGSPGT
jgi:hypothetical protein